MGSVAQVTQSQDLLTALENAHLKFAESNPLSQKSHEERCRSMPGGNTRTILFTTPFPLTIASGRSCFLTTVDGHEYVDFLGEYTAGIYGHNHPVIKKAVERALDNGWNYGGHGQLEAKLASAVCERFPAIDLVRFVNSGTEANMMALATAVAYTGKKKILIFEHGYHGGTISGLSVAGKPTIQLPHDFIIGKYNDVDAITQLLSSIQPDSLAAILVEPMMGSGGCFAGSHEFLTTLRRFATEHKALLIFDEVMTSRLGYNGYGAELGIRPDMMTLGKWIGGGMSFGAFGGRPEIMQMYDPMRGVLTHPGTFNNNVFSMTAGIAGCELLDVNKVDNLNALGSFMKTAVEQVLHQHNIKGNVPLAPLTAAMPAENLSQPPPKMFIKGVGSIMCIHFTGPTKDILQGLFFHHMLTRRIYLAQRGFIALSIEITEAHVDRFVAALDEFCTLYEGALI